MNPIQELRQRVADRFPEAVVNLHTPVRSDGPWSLDVELGQQDFTIEWRVDRGFGLSSLDEAAFGEGHDELYSTFDDAWNRLRSLLLSGGRTQPPPTLHLRRLRELLQVSQVELASKLSVGQAAVSKLERRSDVLISTLASAITALGGQLEITARFPERTVSLLEPVLAPAEGRKKSAATPAKDRTAEKRVAVRTRGGGLRAR